MKSGLPKIMGVPGNVRMVFVRDSNTLIPHLTPFENQAELVVQLEHLYADRVITASEMHDAIDMYREFLKLHERKEN